MATPTFRLATSDDIDAVVDLVESAYRGERSRTGWCTEADLIDGQRVDPDMVGDLLATDGVVVVLLMTEDEGAPVGCCELRRPTDDGPAPLGMFAVDPSRQAAGLGRSVLAEAERFVRDEWQVGSLEITVIDVRTELIEWYRRRGFEPTGEHRDFPYGDPRYGLPRRDDLCFAVLVKRLIR